MADPDKIDRIVDTTREIEIIMREGLTDFELDSLRKMLVRLLQTANGMKGKK